MRDLYRAAQEEESIPSFANRIEDYYLRLDSRKSIRDSGEYCYADTGIHCMSFHEECRKEEYESKASNPKPEKGRVGKVAASVTLDMNTIFSKQLKYQQQEIGNLISQIKTLVIALQAAQSSIFGQIILGNNGPGRGRGSWKGRGNGKWRGDSRGTGQSQQHHMQGKPQQQSPPILITQPTPRLPKQKQCLVRSINLDSVGSVGRLETLRRIALC